MRTVDLARLGAAHLLGRAAGTDQSSGRESDVLEFASRLRFVSRVPSSTFPATSSFRLGEDAFPMPDIDAEMLVDQVTMLGLVSREQLHEATLDAEDASPDSVLRTLLRKGALTSWQVDRLKKGDPSGFFFGDAKVLFHLAEGTFARVYRGEHITTEAPLAIKVLRQRFAMIPDAVDRFHKEAEAGMRLRHPNIVQVIDVGRQENRHFMIMEYVEGMNLRDFMKLRTRHPARAGLAADDRHGPGVEVFDRLGASRIATSRERTS